MAKNMDKHESGGGMGHSQFGATIAPSTVVMFGLMYHNTYALNHICVSQTRMTRDGRGQGKAKLGSNSISLKFAFVLMLQRLSP